MRFTEFDGVSLPTNGVDVTPPRIVNIDLLQLAGGQMVDKDGFFTPIPSQTYSQRFMYSSVTQANLDALYAKLGKRGKLKRLMRDGSTRFCNAKLTGLEAPMNNFDYLATVQRISATWQAEPLWYADSATTVSFSSVSYVSLRANQNGNARAIKYVVLTVTSVISNPFIIYIEPTGSNYYNETTYGAGTYGPDAGEFASMLAFAGVAAGLVVDAGNNTVKEYSSGTNFYAYAYKPATQTALLWLEPGDNIIRFNQAVSGSLTYRKAYV
jgi:hypothetical protein